METAKLPALNFQENDPVGTKNLSSLVNVPTDNAIQYTVRHIGQFHELVNQKSIEDSQLTVLIRVIGNLSSQSSHLDVQTHIIRIVTNQRFLGNISRYMTHSLAPCIHPVEQNAIHRIPHAKNTKSRSFLESALKHLLAYFTFVQNNMKGFFSTQFTDSSKYLRQLLDSYEQQKDEDQPDQQSSYCDSDSEDDLEVASVNTTTATETLSLLRTPYLQILFTGEPDAVIKLVHNQKNELSDLLANSGLTHCNLNLLIQILGSKVCAAIFEPHVKQLQTEILLLVSTTQFLQQLSRYTKTLNRRLQKGRISKTAALQSSKNPHLCSAIAVFDSFLKFCNFLVTNEVRDRITIPVYKELNKIINIGREHFQIIYRTGQVRGFSNKHHQLFLQLKSAYDETATGVDACIRTKKEKKLSARRYTPISSLTKRIHLPGQKAEATQPELLESSANATNSQPVNPKTDHFTFEKITQISQKPANQVFHLLYTERRKFIEFMTQIEITDDQLHLISAIGSKFCGKTEFVHFQNYLFSMLLEDTFLQRVLIYTRQRFRHPSFFCKVQAPPPVSNLEFFENLFTLYNLMCIYSEPKEPSAQLAKNIRSVYGLLNYVTFHKHTIKRQLFSASTLTALQRFTKLFKDLVDSAEKRTTLKKALTNAEAGSSRSLGDCSTSTDLTSAAEVESARVCSTEAGN